MLFQQMIIVRGLFLNANTDGVTTLLCSFNY